MSFVNRNFTLIFAHPDDEILWASSIIRLSDKVITCFMKSSNSNEVTEGRKKAFVDYPLVDAINLGIDEMELRKSADWRRPVFSRYGICDKSDLEKYRAKYHELYAAIKTLLRKNDVVITHNPWGEYGHEEHVLVYNVLAALRSELKLEIYVTGYVSNRSCRAMDSRKSLLQQDPIIRETDQDAIDIISAHYKRYNAWTWWSDYIWPRYESFFLLGDVEALSQSRSSGALMNNILFQEHYIDWKDVAKYVQRKIRNIFKL